MAPRNDLAKTWWSKQWIHALETRALRDPNRLPRGRTYARRGAVFDLEVDEGQITAKVEGSRSRPYRITIGIRRFRPDEWDSLFEVIGSQVGFTADLLAGVVPHELVADAARRGVELLPEAGDLSMNCSCPDWAVPCKHLAAVCYMTASALDTDPFQILRLRGRSRQEVEERLTAQRSAAASPVAATQRSDELAAALWSDVKLEPDLFNTIGRAGSGETTTSHLDIAPFATRWASLTADRDGRLVADVADAARRAALCLAEGQPTLATITPLADAARRAVGANQSERELIARQMAVTPSRLNALAASWITAGESGVAIACVVNDGLVKDWPQLDPILSDVARQILNDGGVRVRATPAWLAVVESKVRLVTDPTGDQWFALHKRDQNWEVLGVSSLEEIVDLTELDTQASIQTSQTIRTLRNHRNAVMSINQALTGATERADQR